MSINIKVPDLRELKPKITVIGVGGAGGNAVNNMIASGLSGVDFIAANTDAQALTMSGAPQRIQLGINKTEGLGAGSKPEIGLEAAEEAREEIKSQLAGSHMVFVAAGMGGGTGTGAAPVVAQIAHDQGILTVGVVTKPFHFEGSRRMRIAEQGVEELKEHVDTLIVIPNQNLFRIANERTTFSEAFKLADRVLHAGIACITDLIIKDGLINLDFADVRAVMNGMGSAVMGTGRASGDHRAIAAAEEAIANPLLDDVTLQGARGLLISITGGDDMTLYEVDEAASRIRNEVDPDANIIMGAAFDDELNGEIRVSIVASGMNSEINIQAEPKEIKTASPKNSAQQTKSASLQAKSASLQERLDGAEDSKKAPPPVEKVEVAEPAPVETPPQAAPRQPEPASPVLGNQETGKVRIEKRPPHLTPAAQPHSPPPHNLTSDREAPFVPAPPVNAPRSAPRVPARSSQRLPEADDFSDLAQREIEAMHNAPSHHGVHKQKKKVGFFERLTGAARQKLPRDSSKVDVSRGRQEPMEPPLEGHAAHEKSGHSKPVNNLNDQAASGRGGISVRASSSAPINEETSGNPEDIDIPPFLRQRSS